MCAYIIKDLLAVFRYLPYGMIVGILAVLLIGTLNDINRKKGKKTIPVAALVSFYMYAAIILCITFLSRETGSRRGMDLKLFSTWGINDRNNAYVIENVLLFIPFGFICPWSFKKFKNPLRCIGAGFITSLFIETLQLITRRGYFQIDDIITNTIGMMVGYVIYLAVLLCKKVITKLIMKVKHISVNICNFMV
jgi:glycopeptide antibiotics resistance protein